MQGAGDGNARTLLVALGVAGLVVAVAATWALARSIEAPLAEAVYIAETVAAGDLSQDFETERGGEFGRLLGGLGEMEDMLTDLVTRIKAATDSIGPRRRSTPCSAGTRLPVAAVESRIACVLESIALVLPPIAAVFSRTPRESEHPLTHTAIATATIMRVVIITPLLISSITKHQLRSQRCECKMHPPSLKHSFGAARAF